MIFLKGLFKKFVEYKNEYETFTSMINKKKEKLFNSKNIEKWGVEPGTEDDIPNYLDNKEVAFSKMLFKETTLLKEEKKRICATIYFLNKQFDKILKSKVLILLKEIYSELGEELFYILDFLTDKDKEFLVNNLIQENNDIESEEEVEIEKQPESPNSSDDDEDYRPVNKKKKNNVLNH